MAAGTAPGYEVGAIPTLASSDLSPAGA